MSNNLTNPISKDEFDNETTSEEDWEYFINNDQQILQEEEVHYFDNC